MAVDECKPKPFSSAACSKGTKSCEEKHGAAVDAEFEAAIDEVIESLAYGQAEGLIRANPVAQNARKKAMALIARRIAEAEARGVAKEAARLSEWEEQLIRQRDEARKRAETAEAAHGRLVEIIAEVQRERDELVDFNHILGEERDEARADANRCEDAVKWQGQRMDEARAEVERLRAKVAKLREALAWIETEATQQQLVAIRDRAFNALAAEKETDDGN